MCVPIFQTYYVNNKKSAIKYKNYFSSQKVDETVMSVTLNLSCPLRYILTFGEETHCETNLKPEIMIRASS